VFHRIILISMIAMFATIGIARTTYWEYAPLPVLIVGVTIGLLARRLPREPGAPPRWWLLLAAISGLVTGEIIYAIYWLRSSEQTAQMAMEDAFSIFAIEYLIAALILCLGYFGALGLGAVHERFKRRKG
jgi:hypothetical protein